jgi:hypothetical protein
VILGNPAPSDLDVSMTVAFDHAAEDADTSVAVGLGFLSGGHTIQFAGDERVTCDGVNLPLKDHAAVFQVLQTSAARAVGVTIHCDYAASGAVAGVSLQVPAVPEITSPRMGAQVVRSSRTLAAYRLDPATCALLGIVALASPPSSPSPKAVAALNTPGPLQATVDTSGFAPGMLVLTASLAPHLTATGASFKSARAAGSATVAVPVTWV